MNWNMDNEPIYMILHQLVHLSKYQTFKRLEEFDLKPGQAGILFVLSCEGELSQRALAKKIGITPPSMTVALRKMEDMGYVGRKQDENDQRVTRIFLTEKGKNCITDMKDVLENMEDVLYKNILPEEKLLFRRLLVQMRQNLMDSKYFKGMDMKHILERAHPPMRDEL